MDLQSAFLEFAGFGQDSWVVWIEDFIAGKPREPILSQVDDPPFIVLNDVFNQIPHDAQLKFRRALTGCLRGCIGKSKPDMQQVYTLLQAIGHSGTSDSFDLLHSILRSGVLTGCSYNGISLPPLVISILGDPIPDENLIRFIDQSIVKWREDLMYVVECVKALVKPGRKLSLPLLQFLLPFILQEDDQDLVVDVFDELLEREGYEAFYGWYNKELPKLKEENKLRAEIEVLESILRKQLIPSPDTPKLSPYGVLLSYSLNIGYRRFTAGDLWEIANLPRLAPGPMWDFCTQLLIDIWRASREKNRGMLPWYCECDERSNTFTLLSSCGDTKWEKITQPLQAYADEIELLRYVAKEEAKQDITDPKIVRVSLELEGVV